MFLHSHSHTDTLSHTHSYTLSHTHTDTSLSHTHRYIVTYTHIQSHVFISKTLPLRISVCLCPSWIFVSFIVNHPVYNNLSAFHRLQTPVRKCQYFVSIVLMSYFQNPLLVYIIIIRLYFVHKIILVQLGCLFFW